MSDNEIIATILLVIALYTGIRACLFSHNSHFFRAAIWLAITVTLFVAIFTMPLKPKVDVPPATNRTVTECLQYQDEEQYENCAAAVKQQKRNDAGNNHNTTPTVVFG